MTPGLAQRLRDGTWTLHGQAERAGVMPLLLRGQLPLPGYCRLLRGLEVLYAALEPALAQAASRPDGAAVQPFADPALARLARLHDDLSVLHGADWQQALDPPPAAVDYARRVSTLAATQPLRLVAHAYVRYLGDLSGGQALARVVRQAYALPAAPDSPGTRFYGFGEPADAAALARTLRAAIDQVPAGDDAGGGQHEPTRWVAEALVAEAQWGFAQHTLMFQQLAEPAPGRV